MDYVSPVVVSNGVDLLDDNAGGSTISPLCTIGLAVMLAAAAVAIWLAVAVEGVVAASAVLGGALAVAIYGVTHDC